MQLIKYGEQRSGGKQVTTRKLFNAEMLIAERAADPGQHYGTDFNVGTELPADLDDSQRLAFLLAFNKSFTVITAKPGYGKTRVVAAIAQAACEADIPVGVGAFTGRAANRARTEIRNHGFDPARLTYGPATLHSIFRIGSGTGNKRGSGNTSATFNPDEAGIFVIDESSMVSAELLADVIRGLPARWNLVLVGDADQLPPIDPGNVMADLINSGMVPVTTLSECYRTDVPGITSAINAIQAATVPPSMPDDSFQVVTVSREDVASNIAEYVIEAARVAGCDPADVFVISAHGAEPKDKRPLVYSGMLNQPLKAGLNPRQYNPRVWWKVSEGDRVYAAGSNSDHRIGSPGHYIYRASKNELGTVISVSDTGAEIQWDDRDGPAFYIATEVWGRGKDKIVDLAYAFTCHKAQGGEAPAVIVVAESDANFWSLQTRQLVYTACSRARKLCVVLDIDGKGFARSIGTDPHKRATLLPRFMREYAEGQDAA